MRKGICQLLVFLSLGVCTAVWAEVASSGEWEPVSAGPGTTWTAPVCTKGSFVVQPFVYYNRTRGTFDFEGNYDALPKGDRKSSYQQQIFAQYGVTDKFEIDVQTVYQENFLKESGASAHARGFGDSYLFARYLFIDSATSGIDLSGLFQLKMPTGKYEHADADKLGTDLIGTGSWDHGYGFALTKKMKPFVFHLDGTYSFPEMVRVDGVKTVYGDYLNYDAAVEYFLPKGFNLLLEVNGVLQGDMKEDGEKVPASDVRTLVVAPGIGWSNDKVQTLLTYQRVVAGENTDANDTVMATLVYTF